MYKLIVKQKVRRTFARLSAGDYEAVVKMFGPRSRFVFSGDHALGGERHGQDAAREWFREMLRLFPGIPIEPRTVVVNGWPWNTVVATHLDDQRNARRRAAIPQRGHAAPAPALGPRGRGPDLRGHPEARRRAEAHAAAEPRPPVPDEPAAQVHSLAGPPALVRGGGEAVRRTPGSRALSRHAGRLTSTAGAAPVMLLTTTGRRSASAAPRL